MASSTVLMTTASWGAPGTGHSFPAHYWGTGAASPSHGPRAGPSPAPIRHRDAPGPPPQALPRFCLGRHPEEKRRVKFPGRGKAQRATCGHTAGRIGARGPEGGTLGIARDVLDRTGPPPRPSATATPPLLSGQTPEEKAEAEEAARPGLLGCGRRGGTRPPADGHGHLGAAAAEGAVRPGPEPPRRGGPQARAEVEAQRPQGARARARRATPPCRGRGRGRGRGASPRPRRAGAGLGAPPVQPDPGPRPPAPPCASPRRWGAAPTPWRRRAWAGGHWPPTADSTWWPPWGDGGRQGPPEGPSGG